MQVIILPAHNDLDDIVQLGRVVFPDTNIRRQIGGRMVSGVILIECYFIGDCNRPLLEFLARTNKSLNELSIPFA